MNPTVTVLVPTNRIGGLDVTFAGLAGQTYNDFELVLVDALHERRAELVAEKARELDLHVTHVAPFANEFPLCQFCHVVNTGLCYARGKIVLFVADYTWLPPRSLALHAAFHRGSPNVGLMCPQDYVAAPPFAPSFPEYGQDEIERYAADVKAGKLDALMWSVFTEPCLAPATLPMDSHGWGGADAKLFAPPGAIGPDNLHMKHESVALEAVLRINGLDETLDGTNAGQDMDLGRRLAYYAGIDWYVDSTNVALVVNPRVRFPLSKRVRPHQENLDYVEAKVPGSNGTKWNLAEKRRALCL